VTVVSVYGLRRSAVLLQCSPRVGVDDAPESRVPLCCASVASESVISDRSVWLLREGTACSASFLAH
jgi:hypothetical protein